MPICDTGTLHDFNSAHVGTEDCGSHVQWRGKGFYCVAIGICELINCHLNSLPNYINVSMQYNYVVSTYHDYCN